MMTEWQTCIHSFLKMDVQLFKILKKGINRANTTLLHISDKST